MLTMPTAQRGTKQVFLIDDDATSTTVVAALLDRLGYRTYTVNDSRDAVQAIRQRRPDAILLDINMPIFDGYQIARALQLDESLNKIPIVAVTSLDDDEHLRRSLEVGITYQITKPVDIQELDDLVTQLVS